MSKTSNGKRGKHRYIIFAAKLYADSGTQKLCTRHSIRLDRLMELVSQRIRDYIGAYYHLEELELPPPKDDHREALLQEQKTLSAQLEKRSTALKTCTWIRCPVCSVKDSLWS